MKSMMGEEPELYHQFEKLAQAAGNIEESSESKENFQDTLQETLGSLAESASKLQADMSEEELLRTMSSLGMEDGFGGEDAFVPLMHGMMKSLLSKDVLYPALKEMADKYPEWMSENQSKVNQDSMEKYRKQHKLMKKICKEFEEEKETDTDSTKSRRFDHILDLMQQMQELGQPPPELMTHLAGGDLPEVDEHGNPKLPPFLPGMPPGMAPGADQCSIM